MCLFFGEGEGACGRRGGSVARRKPAEAGRYAGSFRLSGDADRRGGRPRGTSSGLRGVDGTDWSEVVAARPGVIARYVGTPQGGSQPYLGWTGEHDAWISRGRGLRLCLRGGASGRIRRREGAGVHRVRATDDRGGVPSADAHRGATPLGRCHCHGSRHRRPCVGRATPGSTEVGEPARPCPLPVRHRGDLVGLGGRPVVAHRRAVGTARDGAGSHSAGHVPSRRGLLCGSRCGDHRRLRPSAQAAIDPEIRGSSPPWGTRGRRVRQQGSSRDPRGAPRGCSTRCPRPSR